MVDVEYNWANAEHALKENILFKSDFWFYANLTLFGRNYWSLDGLDRGKDKQSSVRELQFLQRYYSIELPKKY